MGKSYHNSVIKVEYDSVDHFSEAIIRLICSDIGNKLSIKVRALAETFSLDSVKSKWLNILK